MPVQMPFALVMPIVLLIAIEALQFARSAKLVGMPNSTGGALGSMSHQHAHGGGGGGGGDNGNDQQAPDSGSPGAGDPLDRPDTEDAEFNPDQPLSHNCPECERQRQLAALNSVFSEDEMRRLRLEIIKKDILHKLELPAPPSVKPLDTVLPEPLLQEAGQADPDRMQGDSPGHIRMAAHADTKAKTTEVVIFGEEDNPHSSKVSKTFHFDLKERMRDLNVVSSTLWLHVNTSSYSNATISLSDVTWTGIEAAHRLKRHRRRGSRVMGRGAPKEHGTVATDVLAKAGWRKYDFSRVVKKWSRPNSHEHGVKVSCATCDSSKLTADFPVSSLGDKKPFLVIHTENKPNRVRRSTRTCLPNGCCLVTLDVNFRLLGWDFVMQPLEYEANYCSGSCANNDYMEHMPNDHHKIARDYSRRYPAITACCAPTSYTRLSMMYQDKEAVVVKEVPNMIVTSCDCLY